MNEVNAICPNCGSKKINERNKCYTICPVKKWAEEDDYIYPSDYGTPRLMPNGDCEVLIPLYECDECFHQFNSPDVETVE